MSKVRFLVGAGVLVLAAGCSSGSSTPPAPTPASVPPSVVTTSTAPSPSPAPCPDGSYLVTAFEGRGNASAIGKGTGGNIGVDFTAGRFVISSDGSGPVRLDAGPVNANLSFDGEISGTYEGDPSALIMKTTGANGEAKVKGPGFSRTYSADTLGSQLVGQQATAQVTCDAAAGTAAVVLPNASLSLTRR